MKDCSLKPLVAFRSLKHPIDWPQKPLEVEIGFGMGEVLMRKSQELPSRCFIGIEVIWERIYKTMRAMTLSSHHFENVRILQIDAQIAFERFFEEKSIDCIYSLFPCPWPKKKHVKHRLFSHDFLKLLNSRLKDQGELQVVTDYQPYFEWILEEAVDVGFEISTEIIHPQFDTKFERKWQESGQKEFFEINMKKKEHLHIPVKQEVILKGYKVNMFDPEKFSFSNYIGEISVIFKQFLFDKKQKKGEVLLLVSEQDIIQNLRVSIYKKEEGWRICRSDGQSFFSTSGIAKAIELVYQEVVKDE